MDLEPLHDEVTMIPVTGILGHSIGYTISPMLHNAADSASGRMTDYSVFDIAPGGLRGFIERVTTYGEIIGFNVTTPYKEIIFSQLSTVHPQAEEVGAVNTVKVENGNLVGYNTDRPAFASVVNAYLNESDFPRESWKVVILGAGGAAKAALWSILDLGIADEVVILNRSEDRRVFFILRLDEMCANRGVKLLQHDWLDWDKVIDPTDTSRHVMLINTTPLGTMDQGGKIRHDSIIPPSNLLAELSLVFDLVYSPPETRLILAAKQAGVRAVGGGPMLIEQAVLARAIWFNDSKIADERTAMVGAFTTWAAKNNLTDTEKEDN